MLLFVEFDALAFEDEEEDSPELEDEIALSLSMFIGSPILYPRG